MKIYHAANAAAAQSMRMITTARAIIQPLEAGSGSMVEYPWGTETGIG